jgi:aryl-alcohol dehydrogenase-like predicted oxidoreductase
MTQPSTTAMGTWSGGRFMHFGEKLSEDRLAALFRRAYDEGVRTFLTADVYGEGAADSLLGEALAGIDRDTYCLVGAIGHDFYEGKRQGPKGFPRFTDPDLRGPDAYAAYLEDATRRSLERCRTDRFDVLLLHNPDHTGYTSEAVWEGMARLRELGLTESIGVAPGPANGFTVDVIDCMERYGEDIDWAMLILNPFEPWPGELPLPAAAEHDVKVITRVVDYGGLFWDDVKPGHRFSRTDHRAFRPAGWVEQGNEKLELLRPIAENRGLTPAQLACQWNLAHPAVEVVVPTLIQEQGSDARPIEGKLSELAGLPTEPRLTDDDVQEIRTIGDNTGCMALKGSTRQYQGTFQADQWPMTEELEAVAARHGIEPDRDLRAEVDERDLRELGPVRNGVRQAIDQRLYLQLQVFTGVTDQAAIADAARESDLDIVVYADVSDPQGIGILSTVTDPGEFVGPVRELLTSPPFAGLQRVPEMTMLGRTYATGHEPDLEEWLLRRPREAAHDTKAPWAVWYPLRRKSEFYRLPKAEQGAILAEHGGIGRRFAGAGYVQDIRLESYGLDRDDNEFVLGLVSARLDWLSKLVKAMRGTRQTAEYLESLGPFFVGRAIVQ